MAESTCLKATVTRSSVTSMERRPSTSRQCSDQVATSISEMANRGKSTFQK